MKNIDEDLVTYITIHNILRPQGYKILAASYPGAQGDRVILIEAKKGRKQQRRYVDVIAFYDKKNISTLQSNKGEFNSKVIQKEIDEMKNFKINPSHKKGLSLFFSRFEPKAKNSVIRIGVGFGGNAITPKHISNLSLQYLDYFVFITRDLKKWYVCRIGNVDLLTTYQGEVNIPEIFEPTKDINFLRGKPFWKKRQN